jgi:hypothetical protein
MKTLIFTLLLATNMMGRTNTPEQRFVYHYINMEEESIVIAIASSEDIAHKLISDELYNLGLTFEPTNIVCIEPVRDTTLYSFAK